MRFCRDRHSRPRRRGRGKPFPFMIAGKALAGTNPSHCDSRRICSTFCIDEVVDCGMIPILSSSIVRLMIGWIGPPDRVFNTPGR